MKSRIIVIFRIRKSIENPEISEIAISLEFQNSRIPEFFPLGAPAENLSGGRLIRNGRPSLRRVHFQSTYRLKTCASQASLSLILLVNLSFSINSRELVPNCIDGNYVVEVRGKKH